MLMKKIKNHQKVSHYSYGRYGSSATIELENMLKELEQAYVFLTGTGLGSSPCNQAFRREMKFSFR